MLSLPSEGSKEVSSDRLFSALRYLFATQIGVLKIDLFVLYMVPVYAMFALFLQIVIFRWDPGVSFPAVLCATPSLLGMLKVSILFTVLSILIYRNFTVLNIENTKVFWQVL